MKAYAEAEDRKWKRVMPGSSGGSLGDAPPKYRMVYTPPAG
jgi:hypothetical protein